MWGRSGCWDPPPEPPARGPQPDDDWLSELEARQIVRENVHVMADGLVLAEVAAVARLLSQTASRAYRKGVQHQHYRQLGKPPGP